MISWWRLLVMLGGVALAITLPMALLQMSSVASAALVEGFRLPLDSAWMMAGLLMLGLVCSALPQHGFMLTPLAFVLMLMVGACFWLGAEHYVLLPLFCAGGMVVFAMIVAVNQSRSNVAMLLLAAVWGMHAGGHVVAAVPAGTAPLPFVLGMMLACTLMLAIATAFGLTLLGDHEARWQRVRDHRLMQPLHWFFS
jgi:hydrogenase/urease accessory protein HupE